MFYVSSQQKYIITVLIFSMGLLLAQSIPQLDNYKSKKYLQKAFQNDALIYQDMREFAKRLEYFVHSKQKARETLGFGLTPLDLNLLPDEEIAKDVEDGVAEELKLIDKEMSNSSTPIEEPDDEAISSGIATKMHEGIYTPDRKYNSLIDGIALNVRNDLQEREMDPLYFGIHDRGIIRHSNKKQSFHPTNLTESSPSVAQSQAPLETQDRNLLGVGILKGLGSLSRFGNVEYKNEANGTLVRSHFFFGPLNIEVIFVSRAGRLRSFDAHLTAVAAHGLMRISGKDNTTNLEEFIIDSPMPYEIRLDSVKNPRLKTLSQASLTRLFKRGSRMETRLGRSFKRGLKNPIEDPSIPKTEENKEGNTEESNANETGSRNSRRKSNNTKNDRAERRNRRNRRKNKNSRKNSNREEIEP